ncbi:glycoside hydrolase family 3 protein [Hephaestia sp. GCM10023244]|uniref:glycoside hydrolase family 3 protein n=1 Tax=unclassified Hephaestia TaxID=2631281 RepID=UPI0020776227|nr:glycoside hydrolase family 3 protein [Hephaestia sp. MAHUQ-44]MCM8731008.1 glycoside hydrolase family 3 protein [Hephaestia sp. MAHUQ-44]
MMRRALLVSAVSMLWLAGCAPLAGPGHMAMPTATSSADWPAHHSPIGLDPAIEKRVATIVAGMTLEQKIGQMTQADIRSITPADVKRYYVGAVLNGGGAWPGMNKHATPAEWVALSDAYYTASMATDMKVPVPVLWGTDAVHGHNNVIGATLFPHNIGLGAAHDPELIARIGHATAKAVRATGINWAFAPTVAVAENQRWGRSYESWSSDPALVARYAAAAVHGLQGDLAGDEHVIATAKHFLGDGATWHGIDQGESRIPRKQMIAEQAAGYYAALDAGVQAVMVSYSSWNDIAAGTDYGKMHASHTLLTDVLKSRLGFDGIVVSDWNAIEQVPGCTVDHCPQAINAGIDMVMVSDKWQPFIANTVADVRAGRIAMARIDDAVTRILRVKLRTGLFDRAPSAGRYSGKADALQARALAREAVRKSAVLLKNDGAVLPLARKGRLLVVGKSADSFADQSGGWSITWQGTDTTNADFTTGETLLGALRAAWGADNVVYSPDGSGVDPSQFAAVVAVIGEHPYAEYTGDIRYPATMQHSARYPEDLAVLRRVSGKGAPVVSVFYSGRTVYANDLINLSDAFVAAFLPGSEGGGIADLILRKADGAIDANFSGRLSFAWPGSACSIGDGPGMAVQFPRGYGLRYGEGRRTGVLPFAAAPDGCATAAH